MNTLELRFIGKLQELMEQHEVRIVEYREVERGQLRQVFFFEGQSKEQEIDIFISEELNKDPQDQ